MVQRNFFSGLALWGCVLSSAAWGQELARVVSTTPVIQTVSVTEPSCTSVGNAPAPCGSVTHLQNRITHYNVVYEYGGKSYSAALAQDPGPWLPIQVSPVLEMPPSMAPTTVWVSTPAPLPPPPVVVAPFPHWGLAILNLPLFAAVAVTAATFETYLTGRSVAPGDTA